MDDGADFAQSFAMPNRHTAVWIDHKDAKIFQIDRESFEEKTLHAPHHHVHRHPKVTAEHNHPTDGEHFYHEVARALEGADEILVVGPSTAKLELIKHVHKHAHQLIAKIVGVETVDHPTDGQLAAYARTYFRAKDKMQ
jgi:hypothetical protein